MSVRLCLQFSFILLFCVSCGSQTFLADPAKSCFNCEKWNQPLDPYRIYGNTYYVGTAELAAILVVSNAGLVLIDGGLSQSAPLIDANIRKLGFQTQDIKLILNSHTHYDHAGGIAALQKASKATVMASPLAAIALKQGGPGKDDPQFGFGIAANSFPAVSNVQTIKDRDVLTLGELSLTAYFTPGHTLGGTSWGWQSCESGQCLGIVYADSMNPVSAPGFRFFAAASKRGYLQTLSQSINTIAELDCRILLAPHPFYFGMKNKMKQRRKKPAVNPFIEAEPCRDYSTASFVKVEERVRKESQVNP